MSTWLLRIHITSHVTVADGCNPSWIRGGSERPVGVAAKDAAACEVPETKTEKQYINALLKSLICAYVKDQSEAQMLKEEPKGKASPLTREPPLLYRRKDHRIESGSKQQAASLKAIQTSFLK